MITRLQELPSADEVRTALERVFARPEFRPPDKTRWDELRESIGEFVSRTLGKIFSPIASALSTGWVSWIVVIVLGGLLFWQIWRLLVPLLTSASYRWRTSDGPVTRETTRIAAEPELRAAAEHAAAGRFLEAAHALYLGSILWLDEAGHARYEQSKTGEEYVREIGSSAVASPFRTLLRAFYPIAFGGRVAARGTWDRMRSAATEMGVPT